MSEPLRFESKPSRFDEQAGGRPAAGAAGEGRDGPTRVIVKVRKRGYVPAGFDVRTRVDDLLFTAEASEADLVTAGADPDVESIERGRRLRLP